MYHHSCQALHDTQDHPQEVQEDFSSSLLSRPTALLIGVQGQTRMETREAKIHNETKIANCSPKVNENSSLVAFSSYALLSLIEMLTCHHSHQ